MWIKILSLLFYGSLDYEIVLFRIREIMMNKKILVIGGAGYIGSHVQKKLLEDGYKVIVFDNLSSGDKINLLEGAEFVEGDILDEEALDRVMKKDIDAVVHLAAKKAVGESMEKPEIYAKNNICGSINILNAMAKNGVMYIVFSSSAAVYGMPEYVPIDEKHRISPINYYGYTKRAIEENLEWFDKLGKIKFAALRYFNAVGYAEDKSIRGKERNPQNLMPIIMDAATGRRDGFSIFGNDYETEDGTCVRDYIHVSDLALAHSLSICKLFENNSSFILNLGTGLGSSVKEIVDATEKVIGKKLNYSYAPRRAGDPAKLTANAEKAKEVLGWQPKFVNVEDIISTVWNIEL